MFSENCPEKVLGRPLTIPSWPYLPGTSPAQPSSIEALRWASLGADAHAGWNPKSDSDHVECI